MPAEIKAKLLEVSKEEGQISISYLNSLIPEEKTAEFIDEIYDFLSQQNIEVVSHEKSDSKKKDSDDFSEDDTDFLMFQADTGPDGPDIQEPEVAFPQYAKVMREYLSS